MAESEASYLSSGEQSPTRGRTLRRMPARSRLASESIYRRLSSIASGVDASALRERLMSRDLVLEPEEYLADVLLEPRQFAHLRTWSLSEELYRAASLDSSVDLTRFAGHRDTFAMLHLPQAPSKAVELPHAFYQQLVYYLDLDSYKSLRLSCRTWSHGITNARPVCLPTANRIPTEILEKIYDELEPTDFNNARHSCRAWMIVSLNDKLLTEMLRLGGWYEAAKQDLARLQSTEERRLSVVSTNWVFSKRLATECELSPRPSLDHQTRAGLPHGPVNPQGLIRQPTLTSEVDFADLARKDYDHGKDSDPPLRFVVSTIYVYLLTDPYGNPPHEYGGHFHAVASISCPERALAVSMDTSSDRLSVAALLDERCGLVADIARHDILPARKGPVSARTPPAFPANTNRSLTVIDGPRVELLAWNSDGSYASHDISQCSDFCRSCGARDVYRDLCSPQDPPRSVAICPQRRCVAFGNQSGIEIHWLDILSGQELQRWFPLSSPSDCLYFLPNRVGIDSNRKLRVIASADHPTQAKIAQKMYPTRVRQLKRKRSWDYYASYDDPWKLDHAFSRLSFLGNIRPYLEHFNARPLSDGHNVLYTNPHDNRLYLGGDTTPGQGIPQLMRRFVFEGPQSGWLPYIYAGAQELKWGVRVIAGYACESNLKAFRQVWLFSVPIDVFSAPPPPIITEEDGSQPILPSSVIPIRIQGVHIATIRGLAEVSINARDGDLTLRAFSSSLMKAYTWQFAAGNKDVLNLAVQDDGITTAVITDEGPQDKNEIMRDASPLPFRRYKTERYETRGWRTPWDDGRGRWVSEAWSDGAMETPGPVLAPRNTDEDGDVPMVDAPNLASTDGSSDGAGEDEDIIMTDASDLRRSHEDRTSMEGAERTEEDADQDEGYFSGEEAEGRATFQRTGGPFAIHVPPMHDGHWSDGSADWVPDYLAEKGAEMEDEGLGVDLLTLSRLELEMLGL
ncbi:uncharacterized protein KY384_009001 [Bacidia gigantensis]|uniref:uncharacterized protein n=1 Tax=Bacidia gigantensis TaxID=2732470 RepID=UPI001D050844|nr:uncharacterized protein KY384_009001 [Bacidia gigantensis]KAG8525357.1 hypothetical protein KY384_009001 [Bacidia gigantensis]